MIPLKSPRGSEVMSALKGQINGNPLLHQSQQQPNRTLRPIPFRTLLATNAVVGGLEIAASVAFTYIPPMLLKIGFAEAEMTFLFGIGENISLFLKFGAKYCSSVSRKIIENKSRRFYDQISKSTVHA